MVEPWLGKADVPRAEPKDHVEVAKESVDGLDEEVDWIHPHHEIQMARVVILQVSFLL
jgi:hypothetical protein